MTGANYTGGKRNFARARFRDSTRRAQKSHFGRRRLEILSRELGNGAQSKEEDSSGKCGILLEHAQREFSRLPEYMRSNRTEAPETVSSQSSPSISEHGIEPSNVVQMLDGESHPSLRAEVSRVLEFSRAVGLCNYTSTSRTRNNSVSRTSDIDFESRGSPRQWSRYNGSPISEFSERQHFGHPLDGAALSSDNLETTGAGSSHFGSFRKPALSPTCRSRERDFRYTEPASDYEHQPRTHHTPQREAQLIDTPKRPPSQNRFSPGFSDRKFCAFPPSFDALKFPTSPLPPSSPLPSSLVHGSLLSLYQSSHVNEWTPLDFDTTPARGSCGADYSSRSSYDRLITPGSAAASVAMRYWSRSPRSHEVPTPHFMASSSKADLIPELLACDNPWNAIGDMLDLPPIPMANETYFKEITSHHAVSHERVSPLASSPSTRRADSVPSSPARIEDTRLQATPSDDAQLAINSTSHGVESSQASHITSTLLLQGDMDATAETLINLASQSPSERHVSSSGQSRLHTPWLAIGSFPIPDEFPQPQLEPHASPTSPGGPNRTSDWNRFSACVTGETGPRFATPQRSLLPIPMPSQPLMTSALSSPDSMHWDTVSEIDLDALIPKTPSTKTTKAGTQRPKPVYPDLFGDKKGDLRCMS